MTPPPIPGVGMAGNAMRTMMMARPAATAAVGAAGAYFGLPGEAGAGEQEDRVMDLQQRMTSEGYYRGPIDGKMGPLTQEAAGRYQRDQLERQKIEAQRGASEAAKVESERKRTEAEARDKQRREGGEKFRKMEEDVPWYLRAAREYGPMVGLAVGAGDGIWGRGKLAARSAERSANKAAGADALMAARKGDTPSRAARVNQFYNEGGARPGQVPFQPDPGSPRGFRSNPDAPPAASLYQPPSPVTGTDVAAMAAMGTESGVSTYMAYQAQARVVELEKEVERNPTDVNLAALRHAKIHLAMYETAARAGQGGVGGWLTSLAKKRVGHTRPNFSAAEAERTRIDQLLAKQPRGNAMARWRGPPRDERGRFKASD